MTCLTADGRTTKWRWSPPSGGGDRRPFFPSAVSVDNTSGHVFVADLYNEKVYRLDSAGGARCCGICDDPSAAAAVLSRGSGLRGGPAAMAVDGTRRLLYVADEERTVHVFDYSAADHHHHHQQQQQPGAGFNAVDRRGSADEVFF